jgi:hypothetical protein
LWRTWPWEGGEAEKDGRLLTGVRRDLEEDGWLLFTMEKSGTTLYRTPSEAVEIYRPGDFYRAVGEDGQEHHYVKEGAKQVDRPGHTKFHEQDGHWQNERIIADGGIPVPDYVLRRCRPIWRPIPGKDHPPDTEHRDWEAQALEIVQQAQGGDDEAGG